MPVQLTYSRSDKPDEKTSRVQTFHYQRLPENVDPRRPDTE
jgi:hypothetical protein